MNWQFRGTIIAVLSCFLLVGLGSPSWSGKTVDHSLYGELLKKYVKDGVVDYEGFRSEEKRLDQYLKTLGETNLGLFDKKPRDLKDLRISAGIWYPNSQHYSHPRRGEKTMECPVRKT